MDGRENIRKQNTAQDEFQIHYQACINSLNDLKNMVKAVGVDQMILNVRLLDILNEAFMPNKTGELQGFYKNVNMKLIDIINGYEPILSKNEIRLSNGIHMSTMENFDLVTARIHKDLNKITERVKKIENEGLLDFMIKWNKEADWNSHYLENLYTPDLSGLKTSLPKNASGFSTHDNFSRSRYLSDENLQVQKEKWIHYLLLRGGSMQLQEDESKKWRLYVRPGRDFEKSFQSLQNAGFHLHKDFVISPERNCILIYNQEIVTVGKCMVEKYQKMQRDQSKLNTSSNITNRDQKKMQPK